MAICTEQDHDSGKTNGKAVAKFLFLPTMQMEPRDSGAPHEDMSLFQQPFGLGSYQVQSASFLAGVLTAGLAL